MSRHVSVSLIKNCHRKFYPFIPVFSINHPHSSSLPNILGFQPLHSSSLFHSPSTENIQVSKLFPPVLPNAVNEVLSTVRRDSISGYEAVKFLKDLRLQVLFKGVESSNFTSDSKFKILCDVFEQNCKQMPPNLLISGLRSLLEVGVPSEATCVVAAEKVIIKDVYKFSLLNMIGCLYYHRKFQETDLQKEVVAILINEIQKRLYEISTPSEVLMLIHIYHLFKEKEKKNFEHKIIELVPLLSMQEICKMFLAMAENSDRNIFILNVLAFYLRQKTEKPEMKETIDILYAFKKLNFIDPKLFAFLIDHFEQKIPFIEQASLISGILTICGHTRWKHPGVVHACGDWIKLHLDICRTREFVSYVLAVGALNHSTDHTKSILGFLLPHLTLETIKSPNVLLDVAWSLAILDCVPKDLLLKVLSPDFYKPLIDESESPATKSIKLKLLNLKGILKMKYPECIFGCNLFLEPFKLPEDPLIENCRKHVVKVLSNFVPKNKCLRENQVSSMGTHIDAEFIMDQNFKPLSLQEYGTLTNTTSSTKPLPKGCKRIALLILFHKDYTMHIRTITGVNALGTKLLSADGYTVVHISYVHFSQNKTEVEKAKYLLQQIKESVKNS